MARDWLLTQKEYAAAIEAIDTIVDKETTTMAKIADFPVQLQPLIQQGFHAREFALGLKSREAFRLCVARRTVTGGLDQYHTVTAENKTLRFFVNRYGASCDLDVTSTRGGIASQFLQNAYANGAQAAQTLNALAQNAFQQGFIADPTATLLARQCTSAQYLTATDTLTMSLLVDGVARLRAQAAITFDGVYNCYLDPISAQQLWADPKFRAMFPDAIWVNQIFHKRTAYDFIGLRFIPMTEISVVSHPTLPNCMIHSVIISGAGALVEGTLTSMTSEKIAPPDALTELVDGVAMVTCAPFDPLQQRLVGQSWYWVGGFEPKLTADNKFLRAIRLVHIG